MLSKKNIAIGALLVGIMAMPLTPAVLAKDSQNEGNEYQMMATAKVSAADAAQAVVTQAGGKVSSVQIMEIGGKPMFHVEVVNGDKQQDYAVDAATGVVTQMVASERDSGDNEENDDQD